MTPGLLHPVSSVRLSVCSKDFGVGLARHQIAGPHREIVQRPHRINGSFDSLAWSDEAPRQQDGSARVLGHDSTCRDGCSMGDGGQLGGVDVEAVAQAFPGSLVMTTTWSAKAATSFRTER